MCCSSVSTPVGTTRLRLPIGQGALPHLPPSAPLHKALAPSYFTYGSHAAFWMGFTPGVIGNAEPWLNPKAGKLFRMAFAGHAGNDGEQSFRLGRGQHRGGLSPTGLSAPLAAVRWIGSTPPARPARCWPNLLSSFSSRATPGACRASWRGSSSALRSAGGSAPVRVSQRGRNPCALLA